LRRGLHRIAKLPLRLGLVLGQDFKSWGLGTSRGPIPPQWQGCHQKVRFLQKAFIGRLEGFKKMLEAF
jgi:hypothetical protein